MKAMLLDRITRLPDDPEPLRPAELPVPDPGEGEVLIRVSACGVCHTELDEIEGRTPPPKLPVVPGHQVVGRVVACGPGVSDVHEGDRVGVAWIYAACGTCPFCRSGQENLCPAFRATGRDVHGGYAEYMKAPAAFVHPIPDAFTDAEAAPHLCAGAIGYRSLRLTGVQDGQALGLTGFGGSGHLVLKMVRHRFPNTRVHVFARSPTERAFARELGAVWAGDTADEAPEPLDAVIDTTPAWKPVVEALKNLKPGGRLVVNAIRKEDTDRKELLRLDYAKHLWMEREIKSVANVTRRDVREFLALAAGVPLRPDVQTYPLEAANRALLELKTQKIRGAKVLVVS
ncbi:zinc-dependent alcohol dehydrogenase family protein [Rhodocaloribacter litoris]|uniref:zinc-dependent alcohol dehydrogenase family protein n=1 Tax=Rhodocaloribacter litoris TaxID=2558931 RepID=UPI001421D525|nr:zinc-dependent alcohol dehydrogenase family protein [Rhodocaloribacter litoris]QXD14594.1 zinc-dependent alcohol dehydrogenase family protein [Rhodocaloribacter litoris]